MRSRRECARCQSLIPALSRLRGHRGRHSGPSQEGLASLLPYEMRLLCHLRGLAAPRLGQDDHPALIQAGVPSRGSLWTAPESGSEILTVRFLLAPWEEPTIESDDSHKQPSCPKARDEVSKDDPNGSRPVPRSLSENSSTSRHRPWVFAGLRASSASAPPSARTIPLALAPATQERRQIFSTLCVRQISCHSAATFSSPRNRNPRMPRAPSSGRTPAR